MVISGTEGSHRPGAGGDRWVDEGAETVAQEAQWPLGACTAVRLSGGGRGVSEWPHTVGGGGTPPPQDQSAYCFLCLTSRLARLPGQRSAEIVRESSVTWFCTVLSRYDAHRPSVLPMRCVRHVCHPLFIAVAEDGTHTTSWPTA